MTQENTCFVVQRLSAPAYSAVFFTETEAQAVKWVEAIAATSGAAKPLAV